MHRHDDDHDPASAYDGPSRSAQRREALDVRRMADQLAQLSDAQLDAVPLDDDLRREVVTTRETGPQIARKRQMQFLAKCLRREDEQSLGAIRTVLQHDRDAGRRESAQLQRIERWRDRLISEGDAALAEFIDAHPAADRQLLRQLARQARQEADQERPPRAARELFRALRDNSQA